MEDMDGYTGGWVGVMGKAMTEMVIVFFYAIILYEIKIYSQKNNLEQTAKNVQNKHRLPCLCL